MYVRTHGGIFLYVIHGVYAADINTSKETGGTNEKKNTFHNDYNRVHVLITFKAIMFP
jgi:hypothetical protein